MNAALRDRPRVVIIGAGFAGVRTAQKLAHAAAEVVLVDCRNYHTFVPLLYQVATGFIEPSQIAYPLRKLMRQLPSARFILAEVRRVDFAARRVETSGPPIDYDYLVIATGSQTKFLGVPGAPDHTLPMRTLEDAIALRNHILHCFERAASTTDWQLRAQLITFVIVGGGPTGVELAGALQELIRESLRKDFPSLDMTQARVILVQSGDRLLANLPPHLGKYTSRQLRRRGVKVQLQTKVKAVSARSATLADETVLPTSTVIWTAGVVANIPPTDRDLPAAKQNKIVVGPALQLADHPRVYVIGDGAYVEDSGEPLVGVAPEALQQGSAVAANIKRQLRGLDPVPFSYFNKGRAAIIARNAGVAHLFGKLAMSGFGAWLLWLGIHLYYLPGLSNRWNVLASWLKDYIIRDRAVRQIIAVPSRLPQVLPEETQPEMPDLSQKS
ncbi:NAD(P)/FAD-dependent oxidoreductase [Romeria aff. gracilis LEGE 07310]|uniref:NAD(P)/FAD-dependent oxidoreductase n=1 Tax=Vasconcelosia minhoensis LEGE 07310 TaxID=915328 RepID=A0A8J7AW47_9CYAN|nr:NAD(P)/FAD-dependent oxidoreductase [Romeria gracilis]MBE9076827.1 NAD(P)/FAD-dependent oxidoreductase [Romeria aff. gracilis LEGE 07310]